MTTKIAQLRYEADLKITALLEKQDRAEISYEDMTFQIDLIRRELKNAK